MSTAFTPLVGDDKTQSVGVGVVVAPPPLIITQPTPAPGARDVFFAFAFVVHVIVVAALALSLGSAAVRHDAESPPPASAGTFDVSSYTVLRALLVAAGAAAAVAVTMFECLRRQGGALIRVALLMSVALQIIAGGALIGVGTVPAGGVFIVLGLITLVYYGCVRSRIPFAAAHVSIATAALARAPGLACVALGCLIAQTAWSALWTLAALGIEHAVNTGGGSSSTGVIASFLMLVSFFWGSVLIRNVAAVRCCPACAKALFPLPALHLFAHAAPARPHFWQFCAASCVGSYWWHGDNDRAPTAGAAKRALTTSFGTLSLSALLVSIAEAARTVARNASKHSKDKSLAVAVITCVALCVVTIFAALMRFINKWAVVFAALTGASLVEAGTAVLDLFTARGFDAIINDDLVSTALALASVGAAAIGALAGGAVSYAADTSTNSDFIVAHAIIAAILAFCVGLGMASCIASFIETATRAVFVAWALSPGSLAQTHRADFDQIASAWRTAHPEAFNAAGYAQLCAPGGFTPGGAAAPPPYMAAPMAYA